MNKLILSMIAASFCFAGTANAKAIEQEVLELLIANATTIELWELGEKSEANLVEILAEHLMAGDYTAVNEEDENYGSANSVLTTTQVTCKNVTPAGLLGSSEYSCDVMLMTGDFASRKGELMGPEIESAYILRNIQVMRAVAPKAKAQLKSRKVEVGFAG